MQEWSATSIDAHPLHTDAQPQRIQLSKPEPSRRRSGRFLRLKRRVRHLSFGLRCPQKHRGISTWPDRGDDVYGARMTGENFRWIETEQPGSLTCMAPEVSLLCVVDVISTE
jgi:hypothetical protein